MSPGVPVDLRLILGVCAVPNVQKMSIIAHEQGASRAPDFAHRTWPFPGGGIPYPDQARARVGGLYRRSPIYFNPI